MALHCLSWIPEFVIQLAECLKIKNCISPFSSNQVYAPHFPDPVIVNIVSRLPADDVMECRRVCKHWRALTSTPCFAELHLKRVKPSVLVQVSFKVLTSDMDLRFVILDGDGSDKKLTKLNMEALESVIGCCPLVIGSCNGLLLFRTSCWALKYCVINPVAKVQTTVEPPSQDGEIAGFFYDQVAQDYKLLNVHWTGEAFAYFIYSIRTQKWRNIGSYCCRPYRYDHRPIAVNENLYWMAWTIPEPTCTKAILVFSLQTEKLDLLPHPGHVCAYINSGEHGDMILMEMKDRLSLGRVAKMHIEIWVLDHHKNQNWTKKYNVHLLCRCPRLYYYITSLYIENGELLCGFWDRGFFCYHLKLKYMKEYLKKDMGLPEKDYFFSCHAYGKSFITFDGLQNVLQNGA